FSSRRRHTRFSRDWSSDVCSSDLSIIWISLPAEQSGRQGDFATARAVSSFTGPLFLIPDDDNVRLVGGGNINPPTLLTLVKNQEIGRASCREGVEVWGDGVDVMHS